MSKSEIYTIGESFVGDGLENICLPITKRNFGLDSRQFDVRDIEMALYTQPKLCQDFPKGHFSYRRALFLRAEFPGCQPLN